MQWLLHNQYRQHAENIHRYLKLLRTRLSETERQFVLRRLNEERQACVSLASAPALDDQGSRS